MRYDNIMGNRALGMYVNSENVDVSKELLIDLITQIVKNAEEDGFDEVSANDFAIAGLFKILIDTSNDLGLHRLQHDLQRLSVDYGLSNCDWS